MSISVEWQSQKKYGTTISLLQCFAVSFLNVLNKQVSFRAEKALKITITIIHIVCPTLNSGSTLKIQLVINRTLYHKAKNGSNHK